MYSKDPIFTVLLWLPVFHDVQEKIKELLKLFIETQTNKEDA